MANQSLVSFEKFTPSGKEWFLVGRSSTNFVPVFCVKAYDSEDEARCGQQVAGILGDYFVVHQSEFIPAICEAVIKYKRDMIVNAYLDNGVVFPVRFLYMGFEQVKIELPEMS